MTTIESDTPTTTTPTVRPEVQRGADLLDSFMPGWDRKINLATLHLNWCDKCVLGQLFRWYDDGLKQLFGSCYNESRIPKPPYEHGFSIRSDDDDDWDQLTEEWRDLIASRRA